MTCWSCDWLTDGEFQVLQDQEELLELRALLAYQAFEEIPDHADNLEFGDRKVHADHQEEKVYEVLEVLKAW